MKRIYLDWDGVGNDHTRHANGYNGAAPVAVQNLNALLEAVPDARIIITSAWRYLVLNGSMAVKGLEALFLTHGLNCYDRIENVTDSDENFEHLYPHFRTDNIQGCQVRAAQIRQHRSYLCHQGAFVVLDDLPIPVENLVQTDGKTGMSWADVGAAVNLLNR